MVCRALGSRNSSLLLDTSRELNWAKGDNKRPDSSRKTLPDKFKDTIEREWSKVDSGKFSFKLHWAADRDLTRRNGCSNAIKLEGASIRFKLLSTLRCSNDKARGNKRSLENEVNLFWDKSKRLIVVRLQNVHGERGLIKLRDKSRSYKSSPEKNSSGSWVIELPDRTSSFRCFNGQNVLRSKYFKLLLEMSSLIKFGSAAKK